MKEKTPGQSAAPGDPATGSGVLKEAQCLFHELLELIHDRFRLAALETQRAGQTLVVIIVSGVMIVILLIGSWLGLMAAAVIGLIEMGLRANSAILLVIACHLLIALILIGVIRRKSRYLRFPATRRSFQPISARPREAKKS